MQSEEDKRRGSLAISALLNEDTIDPIKSTTRASSVSPVLSNNDLKIISNHTKTKRKRISSSQYNRLMEVFDQTDTPSSEIRENLAAELDMSKREVQVWFQNRRAKVNRSKYSAHQTVRQRQSSLIVPPQYYQVSNSNRRASSHPVMEQRPMPSLPPQQLPFVPPYGPCYPIAPMPMMKQQQSPYIMHSPQAPPPPSQQKNSYHPYSRQPNAIDLLASAAEYVRTDRNEV